MRQHNEKQKIRSSIQIKIKRLDAHQAKADSNHLCKILLESEIWLQAHTVLLFAPIQDEPQIWPLAQLGLQTAKKIYLPKFEKKTGCYIAKQIRNLDEDVTSGKYGVREPQEWCPEIMLNSIELSLVPGIAFTISGKRLGRGKGYYDHLLASIDRIKCGVAYGEQIVSDLPMEPHDILLDYLVTPSRLIHIID